MGCGIDIIYPAENRKLAQAIVDGGGALVSELPVGTPPIAENFPGRNRLISGLCLGVVIVEAAEKSGSLITARMALEQDRQVFAVPGSPLTGKSRGSNRLLKEGARLVDCAEDVIEDLLPQLTRAGAESAWSSEDAGAPGSAKARTDSRDIVTDEVRIVLSCLKDADKLHVDSIIESSRLNTQTVLNLLLELELKGIVTQHPGKLFSLA
jgi:DNA processing protein